LARSLELLIPERTSENNPESVGPAQTRGAGGSIPFETDRSALSCESHADPFFLAPNDVTMVADIAGHDVQRDLMGDSHRARDLKGSPGPGHIANGAIDSGAIELNRSGLEDSPS
jgi:hypothetical protein